MDVFRVAYIGIGGHSRVLYHAVQEIKSFIKRIFATLRLVGVGLVDVFTAAYIEIGAHSRLLYHAVQEMKSFFKRIFASCR